MDFIVNTPAFEPSSTVVEKTSKSHIGRPDHQPAAAGAPRGAGAEAWWLPPWEEPPEALPAASGAA
eukprot:4311597-Heterocapsa_arctica.AAC.1